MTPSSDKPQRYHRGSYGGAFLPSGRHFRMHRDRARALQPGDRAKSPELQIALDAPMEPAEDGITVGLQRGDLEARIHVSALVTWLMRSGNQFALSAPDSLAGTSRGAGASGGEQRHVLVQVRLIALNTSTVLALVESEVTIAEPIRSAGPFLVFPRELGRAISRLTPSASGWTRTAQGESDWIARPPLPVFHASKREAPRA